MQPVGLFAHPSDPHLTMRPFTRSERLKYWFDNTMSAGTPALIAWLAVATIALVAAIVVVVIVTGIAPVGDDGSVSTPALIWDSFMQAVGAEAIGSDAGSWPFIFAMLVLMIGGLFIASTLIGVLTSGIEGKLDELQRGRSFVAETNHTVVLGWSSKTPAVVRELVLANESKSDACIAVLADVDRTEMEESIREALENRPRTRVVCRTGDPIVLGDLDIVNPLHTKAIVIPSPETDEPDAQVVKMILALSNHPEREESKGSFHIVAELNEASWKTVAHMVGDPDVESVLIHDVISRIIAQVARQKGLSVVVQELLTFEGNEFYYAPSEPLIGRTYAEALFAYPHAALVGIHGPNGADLNPAHDHIIGGDDKLILLAEDDTQISRSDGDERLSAAAWDVDESLLSAPVEHNSTPEQVLILGWSPRAPRIICTLDGYFAPGSTIIVATTQTGARSKLEAQCGAVSNVDVSHRVGDPSNRDFLESLEVGEFDHIIVLSRSEAEPQAADTHALVALLHLRDIAEKNDYTFNIVSEMNDVRNQALAEVTRADDFVVSDKLISLMVAQISENRGLADVFAELFSPEGAELYLRPVSDYVVLEQPMSFYTVVEAVRRRNETAVGFRRASESFDEDLQYGVHLNPKGTDVLTFGDGDQLIVLANN